MHPPGLVSPLPDYRPATLWVYYTTRCKHSLSLLMMGEINARNMSSWLRIVNELLSLHLDIICFNDAWSKKYQTYLDLWSLQVMILGECLAEYLCFVRSEYQGASRLLTLGTELCFLCFRECGECISRARSLSCTKERGPELMRLLRLSKKRWILGTQRS
jgi:hypothetical protein